MCKNLKKPSIFAILSLIVFFCVCGNGKSSPNLEKLSAYEAVSNNEETISLIREGLKGNSRSITVTFRCSEDISAELTRFAAEWMEAAMAESESPVEGDYIRYRLGGYKTETRSEMLRDEYIHKVKIIPKYYTYLVQEEEVSSKIKEIFEGFAFDERSSDYEKISAIYGYICSNVSYDRVHAKNPYYFLRSTAYGALIQGTATCQGYSLALYRMLKEAGISARIIRGRANGEEGLHAWNIAELDGIYYNLDATWDAGKENYEYFLKGAEDFSDHIPREEFISDEFRLKYPIAEKSVDWRE